MKIILQVILCCILFTANAQEYETGKIIDDLSVSNSNNETYALYLPTTYNADIPHPIMFIFAPSGVGKKGIKPFIKSAEAYKYILICSNNSLNGALMQNLEIAQRLFNHAFSNFKILKNRTYLAGFSGGARLASAIASASNEIEGVIACGAGFISSPNWIPTKPNFSYVGLCGNEDFNYQEMFQVKDHLDKYKFSSAFFFYDDTHKWPPDEQLSMAFNWLEMEAVKNGHISKPDLEIKESYFSNLENLENSEKKDELLMASLHYERIINSYDTYFDLDSLHLKLAILKKGKNYSNEITDLKEAFKQEVELSNSLLKRFNKDYNSPKSKHIKWWRKEIANLNKKAEKANAQMKKMYERVKFKIFVAAYSKVNSVDPTMSEEQNSFCENLIQVIRS